MPPRGGRHSPPLLSGIGSHEPSLHPHQVTQSIYQAPVSCPTRSSRTVSGRFPCSMCAGRQGWCPAFPRQPRHGYAAGLPRGLPGRKGRGGRSRRAPCCLFGARRALLTGPHPAGSSRLCRLRGFHHWFTRRCTVLPCLPDPGRLAVPTRPVVVRAAPTLPGASQAGLPPASAGLLRQPSGGSFHPTRSHSASWRTPRVQVESGRALAWPAGLTTRALDRWDVADQRLQQQRVVGVGGRQPTVARCRPGRPAGGTSTRPCCGRSGSGRSGSPRLARTLKLSRLVRDQSTWPLRPSSSRSRWCVRCHTTRCQSRSRAGR
jgi:hypothetical protein